MNCKKCNKELNGKRKVYCSDRCARSYAKRFREKAISLHGEKLNRIELFNEFGWVCNRCGCKTPESLINTTNPNSPQLDHIVPISKGGRHVRTNVQLLCRGCNIKKSNKMPSNVIRDIPISIRIPIVNVDAFLNFINKHSYL